MWTSSQFFSLEKFPHPVLFRDTRFAWDALIHLKDFFQKTSFKIKIPIPQTVSLVNKQWISIGEGTVIEPGVLIEGPCIIGTHCQIRHGAFLRGLVVLGDHCTVGHGSEIKKSILMNGAAAAHLCYVGDSILGTKVNLGAGVKCSNVRLDGREIAACHEGVRVETGLRKLGAIVGDGAQIGCNCVLNPGTFIGQKSLVYPLLNIGGYIPSYSQVQAVRNWIAKPMPETILQKLLK